MKKNWGTKFPDKPWGYHVDVGVEWVYNEDTKGIKPRIVAPTNEGLMVWILFGVPCHGNIIRICHNQYDILGFKVGNPTRSHHLMVVSISGTMDFGDVCHVFPEEDCPGCGINTYEYG